MLQHKIDKRLLNKTFALQYRAGTSKAKVIDDLLQLIDDVAPGSYVTIDNAGNITAKKGPRKGKRPFVVAHYDQVHHPSHYFATREYDGKLYAIDGKQMKQIGVGGDDKCGIYAALVALRHYEKITAIFFADEEVGCIGSAQYDLSQLTKASVVLQADRRGGSDAINISNCVTLTSRDYDLDVAHILEFFGYSHAEGTVTDVGELKSRGMTAPAMNLSAGYYNAHTPTEYVVLSELANCTALMLNLCAVPHISAHNSVGEDTYRFGKWSSTYDVERYKNYGGELSPFPCPACGVESLMDYGTNGFLYCENCMMWVDEPDVILEHAEVYVAGELSCPYCMTNTVGTDSDGHTWCWNCGNRVEISDII